MMDNNVDEKYVIVVTYAVSNEEHDGYCSGNDSIDRVKLRTEHRYHELGCVGRKNPSKIPHKPGNVPGHSIISPGTCQGRSDIEYETEYERIRNCSKEYDYAKELKYKNEGWGMKRLAENTTRISMLLSN